MKERNSEVDTYLYDIGVVFYIISSQADAFFYFSQLPSATHIKKTNYIGPITKPLATNSLLGENKEDQQC